MSNTNRSLERGLAVLECFRPGVGALSHQDIVERTALPKATVSRLLQSFIASGYLVVHGPQRGYRLGVPVLSLARCMALEDKLRGAMAPLIADLAHATQSIIGFGTAHDTDIVYLESVNGDPERSSRQVGAGMRAPLATTSVGHAYIAGLPAAERERLLDSLSEQPRALRSEIRKAIDRSMTQVRERGHCLVMYAEGKQAAVGVPIALHGFPLHALGVGYRVPPEQPPRHVPANILKAIDALTKRAASIAR